MGTSVPPRDNDTTWECHHGMDNEQTIGAYGWLMVPMLSHLLVPWIVTMLALGPWVAAGSSWHEMQCPMEHSCVCTG
jgi:hypothetical protein